MEVDHAYLLGWEVTPHNPEKEKSQKLKLALQKRRIISEEIGRLNKVVKGIKKKDSGINDKNFGGELKLLEDDPFIRFYLKIYRELCGKKDIQEITNEVCRRWNEMKRKPRIAHRKKHKGPSKAYGLVFRLALRQRQKGEFSQRGQNKVELALIKNKIVSEEIARLTNFIKKMNKEKKYSTPFIKIYLKVFREMCGRSNEQEIKREAIRRWNVATQTREETSGKPHKYEKHPETRKLTNQYECRMRHKHGQTKKHDHDVQTLGKKRKCEYHTYLPPHIRHDRKCSHHHDQRI